MTDGAVSQMRQRAIRAVGAWRGALLTVAVTIAAASCSGSGPDDPVSRETTASTSVTVAETHATTNTTGLPSTTTTEAPATSQPTTSRATAVSFGPLVIEEYGIFLGISSGSTLSFAADALDATPVPFDTIAVDPRFGFCQISDDRWAIQSGGLTLVFDGFPGQEPFLTNWAYIGGPVGPYTEMVVPGGVGIGDTRQALLASDPDIWGTGDELFGAGVRFLLDGDIIISIREVQCGD